MIRLQALGHWPTSWQDLFTALGFFQGFAGQLERLSQSGWMLSVGPFDGFFERPGRRWRVENSETWVQLGARQKPRSGRCIEMYREKCDHVIFDLLRIWNTLRQRSPRKGLMSAVGWPWCIQAVGNWIAPLPKKLSEPRRFNLSQDTDDIYFQTILETWQITKTSSTYNSIIQLIHIHTTWHFNMQSLPGESWKMDRVRLVIMRYSATAPSQL